VPHRASLLLLLLAWIVDPCWAGPRLSSGAEAPPLPAWISFCERSPAECAVQADEPDLVTLTAQTAELIASVNRTVNHSLTAITDEQHWGVADDWDLPRDGQGDCEDYQLLKRHMLVTAGLPRRALRMTVVLDAFGAGHAVLTVRTDQGDFILDNLTDAVLLWSDTPYRFIKRESTDRVGWVSLVPETDQIVTASAQK
jgi:predicted transglutaminase-like cysteine proteinase